MKAPKNKNNKKGTLSKSPSRGPSRVSSSSHFKGKPKASNVAVSTSTHRPQGRIVVGHHAILRSLIVYPQGVTGIWIKAGSLTSIEIAEIVKQAEQKKINVTEKPQGVLDHITTGHQGAILFQTQSHEVTLEDLFKKEKVQLLLLDGVEDPHNLGAIMRTAWLMGVEAILVPEHRAVHLTPAVHKVASGGAEHVTLMVESSFQNLIERLKENQFWVFGLAHDATRTVFDLQVSDKILWCLGAEDKGLRTSTRRLCDELVRLPQLAEQASYNVSVAAGMVMSETFRQWSLKQN